MKGLIVFPEAVIHQRTWYIEKYMTSLKALGIGLEAVTSEALKDEIVKGVGFKCNKQELRTDKGGFPWDFAIMRAIEPDLSARLEALGIPCFNSAEVSRICNDKLATYRFIKDRTDVPFMPVYLPRNGALSSLEHSKDDLMTCSPSGFEHEEAAFPLVLKSRRGHGGTEVFCLQDEADFQAHGDQLESGEFILQEMASNPGVDVRVYVVDGQVLRAMRRENAGAGDRSRPLSERFRSNYCLGGNASVYDLEADSQMKEMVEKICQVIHLDFAGIDFIFHQGRPVFNEIEDVVGARMLYDLTEDDPVDLYCRHIAASIFTKPSQ